MQVLIVDDSKAMRMIVRRALRQANLGGHNIEEAANGVEALGKLREARYDVILADWNMPEMNGLELLKVVRSEALSPHFGFITSESNDDTRQLALESGAEFVVTKPFTPEALQAALGKILK